jgi:hypothetical protein
MRTLPRLFSVVLIGAVLLGPAARFASATTIDDLIKLKAARVSDDVLIALIESDGSVFYLSADDVLKLRDKGLSDKVVVAMLMTGAKARQAGEAAVKQARMQQQAEQAQVDERYRPASEQQQPPTVNVTQTVTQTVEAPQQPAYPNFGSYPYYQSPLYLPVTYPYGYGGRVNRPVVTNTPVYWGYGGQRRPDTWALSTEEVRRAREAGQTAVAIRK